MKASEIAHKLAEKAEEVCLYLFPNGKRKGHEYGIGGITGEEGDSLQIHLTGDKAGIWADFATGEKGDLIDLWRLSRNVPFAEAMQEIREYLGIKDPVFQSQKKTYIRPDLPGKPVYGRALDYLKGRGLTEETLKENGIRSTDDLIIFPFYDPSRTLIMTKTLKIDRKNGKKEIFVSKESEPILFGWKGLQDATRSVCLCEGEIDQLSLWQMDVPSLSVPFGAGNHQWVEREWERLESFDQIFLCFDDDEPGKEGAKELARRLGRERCRIVSLPKKDPNECLMAAFDLEPFFRNAAYCDPEGLHPARKYEDDAMRILLGTDDRTKGMPLPWGGQLSFRPGEMTIWNGINGHGKTEILNHLTVHAISEGEKILYCSLEMPPENILSHMIRQAAGTDKFLADRGREIVRLLFGDLYFYRDQKKKLPELLEAIRYAARRYGTTQIIVDNLSQLCWTDDYRAQQDIVQGMSDLKAKENIHIHLVAHSRKGDTEMESPDKMDVRGAGVIVDIVDNLVIVFRNKKKQVYADLSDAELQIKKLSRHDVNLMPDTRLYIRKQRMTGWEGMISLWFDPPSCQFRMDYSEAPVPYDRPYINYSETDF